MPFEKTFHFPTTGRKRAAESDDDDASPTAASGGAERGAFGPVDGLASDMYIRFLSLGIFSGIFVVILHMTILWYQLIQDSNNLLRPLSTSDVVVEMVYLLIEASLLCSFAFAMGGFEVVHTQGGPSSNNNRTHWISTSKSISAAEAPHGFGGWVVEGLTPLLYQILVLYYYYEGEWKDGQRNGPGTYTYPDGAVYKGEFKKGKYHGQGTYTTARGAVYNGEWKEDKYNGQGISTAADGSVYNGEWKDGQRNGHGTYTYPDGAVYKGEYKQGKYHGQGTYTTACGAVYNGEWKDGQRNGHGTYTWTNGSLYKGEWKDDQQHGQGTYTWSDGATYRGSYQKHRFHGPGLYTSTKRQGDTIPINATMGKFSIDDKPMLLDMSQKNLEGAFELVP